MYHTNMLIIRLLEYHYRIVSFLALPLLIGNVD